MIEIAIKVYSYILQIFTASILRVYMFYSILYLSFAPWRSVEWSDSSVSSRRPLLQCCSLDASPIAMQAKLNSSSIYTSFCLQ